MNMVEIEATTAVVLITILLNNKESLLLVIVFNRIDHPFIFITNGFAGKWDLGDGPSKVLYCSSTTTTVSSSFGRRDFYKEKSTWDFEIGLRKNMTHSRGKLVNMGMEILNRELFVQIMEII